MFAESCERPNGRRSPVSLVYSPDLNSVVVAPWIPPARAMGGKRARSSDESDGGDSSGDESEENSFEAERNAMIEENRQRMLALGLLDDADMFRTSLKAARVAKQKLAASSSPAGPIRRSTRLQGITRVSYKEMPQYATYDLTYNNSPRKFRASKPTTPHRPAYTGPVRRSSRLQDTTTVSYKDQLQDDPDELSGEIEDED